MEAIVSWMTTKGRRAEAGLRVERADRVSGMSVYVRQACERDQPAIRALIREAGINPLHLHWRNFIVAQDRDCIAACGQLRPHGDGSAELASIAVTPAYQGLGIGRAIVATLVDTHEGDLYLMCDGKMQPFYRRFGFAAVRGRDLPREMRLLFGLGSAIAWGAARLLRQQVSIAAMRRL